MPEPASHDAKTQRASVEQWRVMHALSLVDRGESVLNSPRSEFGQFHACTVLTQVQRTVKLEKELEN